MNGDDFCLCYSVPLAKPLWVARDAQLEGGAIMNRKASTAALRHNLQDRFFSGKCEPRHPAGGHV
jgi:hypothetical protein